MYTTFFGLQEKPFDLLPNPDFLYLSRAHKRALTYLMHGIREKAGFILLTGEVGSGKTTIIRNIIRKHLQNRALSKVFNTRVDSHQLLAMINEDFGLSAVGKDKTTLIRELNDFLIGQYSQGRQAVLIIDEAQNLSPDLLEEVRMLSNLETDREKLLQIILVGQPELKKTLALPALLQLRQRIQINCHIQPLNPAEVEEYILFRLEKAGNREAVVFSSEAVEAVAAYSRGVPRLINIICDYIMLDAFSAQQRDISAQIVHELAKDLSFDVQYWESKAAEPEEAQEDAGNGIVQAAQAARASVKLNNVLRSLNQRLEALEAVPRFDQSDIMDIRERLDEVEKALDARVKELWLAQQQFRVEMTMRQMQHGGKEIDETKKQQGTMRLIWNFLWGN